MQEFPVRDPMGVRAEYPSRPSTRGYVLHGPRSLRDPRRAALTIVAVVAGLCGVVVLGGVAFSGGTASSAEPFWYSLLALCVIVPAVVVTRQLSRPELLRIDRTGVSYDEIMMPWQSICQVVVIRPGPPGASTVGTQLGLRLQTGGPLPAGMTPVEAPGGDPTAIPESLKTHVTAVDIDVEAALDAAQRFAPAGVGFAEQFGDGERVLRR